MGFQRRKPATVGVKAPFPAFVEPALATSVEKAPGGDRWIHEIKFDGYRVQLHLANTEVTVYTRRGHDWTERFAKVAGDAWHIQAGSAIIDGAVVVPSPDGTTDFSVLQNELKGKSTRIVMVAFDMLYLNGYDLRKLPLTGASTIARISMIPSSRRMEIERFTPAKSHNETRVGIPSSSRIRHFPNGRCEAICNRFLTFCVVGDLACLSALLS